MKTVCLPSPEHPLVIAAESAVLDSITSTQYLPILSSTSSNIGIPNTSPTRTATGHPTSSSLGLIESADSNIPTSTTPVVPVVSSSPAVTSHISKTPTHIGSNHLATTLPQSTVMSFSTTSVVSRSGESMRNSPSSSLLPIGGPDAARKPQAEHSFTSRDYFIGTYLATFLAVFLKQVWTLVFASFKMMEPFYKLSQPEGANAHDSLFTNYFSTNVSLDSLRSTFVESPVMALVSIIYLLISVTAPLASESVSIESQAICRSKFGNSPCDSQLVINQKVVYVMQSLFGTLSILLVALMLISRKRKSGIFSNPSSIATMASLLHHPDVLAIFRDASTLANSKLAIASLAGIRFKITTYESVRGQGCYGLIKVSDDKEARLRDTLPYQFSPVCNPSNSSASGRKSSWCRSLLQDVAFGILILVLLCLIAVNYEDVANDSFNHFFNSNSFGPKFILTGFATLINIQWNRLERGESLSTQ